MATRGAKLLTASIGRSEDSVRTGHRMDCKARTLHARERITRRSQCVSGACGSLVHKASWQRARSAGERPPCVSALRSVSSPMSPTVPTALIARLIPGRAISALVGHSKLDPTHQRSGETRSMTKNSRLTCPSAARQSYPACSLRFHPKPLA